MRLIIVDAYDVFFSPEDTMARIFEASACFFGCQLETRRPQRRISAQQRGIVRFKIRFEPVVDMSRGPNTVVCNEHHSADISN